MPDKLSIECGSHGLVINEDLAEKGPVAILGVWHMTKPLDCGEGLACMDLERAAVLRDWLDTFLQERGGGVLTPDDGVSMAEAARRVGVHYRTIRNWVQKGQLPATRFGPSGKIIRIDPADLARVRRPA